MDARRPQGLNTVWLFPLCGGPRAPPERLLWVGAGVLGRPGGRPRLCHRWAEPGRPGQGPLLSLTVLIRTPEKIMAPASDANEREGILPVVSPGCHSVQRECPQGFPLGPHLPRPTASPLPSHRRPAVPGSHFAQPGVPAWSSSPRCLLSSLPRSLPEFVQIAPWLRGLACPPCSSASRSLFSWSARPRQPAGKHSLVCAHPCLSCSRAGPGRPGPWCTEEPAQCSAQSWGARSRPSNAGCGPRSLSQCLNCERKLQDGHFCTRAQLFLVNFPSSGSEA